MSTSRRLAAWAGLAPATTESAATPLAEVLQPAFLRKLDRLQLRVRHSLATRPGTTPMPYGTQPSGIELANYKAYAPGDDLRYLDWNAYGRLDQLLIKTFRAEREAALHVFVDCSASMRAPAIDRKFPFALGLAASLGYVSLRHNDPVRLIGLGNDRGRLFRDSPWFRHRDGLAHLRDFLASLRTSGITTLADGITAYANQTRVPGVAVVLSDFLVEPSQYEAALRGLVGRGWTVAALRLLGPVERDPAVLFRRGRLRDVESGRERIITLTTANRARYQTALTAHLNDLRHWCQRHEVFCATLDPMASLETTLFYDLAAIGMLK